MRPRNTLGVGPPYAGIPMLRGALVLPAPRTYAPVPRQNSIHAKNDAILPPSQREKSNSSKNCFEEREGSLGWERAHATYI
jgi:hypothetical protein